MTGTPHPITRPLSVKEITTSAEEFDFNPQIPFKFWLRTAGILLKEAAVYEQERNDQQAYLLLMRYASLIAANLPNHPSAQDAEHRREWTAAVKSLNGVLERMDKLKPRITARYEMYQKALERRRKASTELKDNGDDSKLYVGPEASDPAIAGNGRTLIAKEDSAFAVKLAHKEFRRRDAVKRSPQKSDVVGLWDDWEAGLSKDGRSRGERSRQDEEMRRDMEASRHHLDGAHESKVGSSRSSMTKPTTRPVRPAHDRDSGSNYRYPSIHKSQPSEYESMSSSRNSQLPPKPPKEYLEKFDQPPPGKLPKEYMQTFGQPLPPPSLPAKTLVQTFEEEEDDKEMQPPNSYLFKASAYLESGKPLRTIFLPPTLRQKFLDCAAPNTRKNLETCGVICGKLMSNALFVSHLVIPEQVATSDTCDTVNEVALFEYCEAEDLIVLGWIHTHPTQTCFLSSRDLHTHFGYQMMLAESIAIVCAPTQDPSWGVFRLTDPPGKQCVGKCTNQGLFHPHDTPDLYTDAMKPGHVMEAAGLEYKVMDLRP